jgi:DNA polymerase III delta prime subunit
VRNWESLTRLQQAQIIGWFEDILIDEDYEDLEDVVESIINDDCFYYRHNLTIDHANNLLDKVERLEFKFKITSKERTLFNDDQSSVLLMLNKVTKGVKSRYY